MAERYATVITNDEGQEVISNIAQIEGKPSQPSSDAKLIKIGDGVKIGMVKGGKVDASGVWGFPSGTPSQAAGEDKADDAKDKG